MLAGEPHANTFPPADQVKIAERFAVGTVAPVVAKVPFRTDYPPGGFALQSVSGQSLTTEHPAARRGQPHQPVQPGQHWCATTLPGGEFYVAVEDPSKTLSDDELLRIFDGLAFADIKDTTTWFPAA